MTIPLRTGFMKVFFIPLFAMGFAVALESPLAAEWFLTQENRNVVPSELKPSISVPLGEYDLK